MLARRQKSLAVPTLGGIGAVRARNSWQCQSSVAPEPRARHPLERPRGIRQLHRRLRTPAHSHYHKPGYPVPHLLRLLEPLQRHGLRAHLDAVVLKTPAEVGHAVEHVIYHERPTLPALHEDAETIVIRHGVVDLRKAPVPFVESCEPHRDVIAIHEDVVGSGNRLDQKERS